MPVVCVFIYSTHIYFIMYIMYNWRFNDKQINTVTAYVCRAQCKFCGDCLKLWCFTWGMLSKIGIKDDWDNWIYID